MNDKTFAFENTKPTIEDAELLADLRRVRDERGIKGITQNAYRAHGRFSTTAIKQRFGSWNTALTRAGLTTASRRDIPQDELFDNLRDVWIRLGRQPRKREMVAPVSRFSHHPYTERFGGWLPAVRRFLEACEGSAAEGEVSQVPRSIRGPRDPSLRLRFLVLRRDGFRCRQCGASPAISPGVELHVDHVVAWSQGGPTSLENLQTLCTTCNLGKGSLASNCSG